MKVMKLITKEWRDAFSSYDNDKIIKLLENTKENPYDSLKEEFHRFLKSYLVQTNHKKGELEKTINICKTILGNSSENMVTEELLQYTKILEYYHGYQFSELLMDYAKTNNDEADKCYICLSELMKFEMITGACNCVYKVHLSCIQKYIKKLKKDKLLAKDLDTSNKSYDEELKCSICGEKYKLNEQRIKSNMINSNYDENIFFPFIDCYPVPLFTNQYHYELEDEISKINYAIVYLQTED